MRSVKNRRRLPGFFLLVTVLSIGILLASSCTKVVPTTVITASPSMTQTPTLTLTPAAITNLTFPVLISTLFSNENLPPITTDNAANLNLIAYRESTQVYNFVLSPDGKRGFISTDSGLIVYDLASSQVIAQFDKVILRYRPHYSLSYDGSRFAVIKDSQVEVWDLFQGKIFELTLFAIGDSRVFSCIAISPDGKTLAVRDFPDMNNWLPIFTLYDIESKAKIDSQPDASRSWYIEFSPAGNWMIGLSSSSDTSTATLWRTSDWSKAQDIPLQFDQKVAGFSPDDQLIAFQTEKQIAIYRIEDKNFIRLIPVLSEEVSEPRYITFSPDSNLIGIGENDGIYIWNIVTGEPLGKYPKYDIPWILSDDGIPTMIQIPEEISSDHGLIMTQDYYNQMDAKFLESGQNFIFTKDNFYYDTGKREDYYIACTVPLGNNSSCQGSTTELYIHTDGIIYTTREISEPGVFEIIPAFSKNPTSIGTIHSPGSLKWISSNEHFALVTINKKVNHTVNIQVTEIWDIAKGKLVKCWDGYISKFAVSADENILAFPIIKNCGMQECGNSLIVYVLDTDQILLNRNAIRYTEYSALIFTPGRKLIFSISDSITVSFYFFDPKTKEVTDPNFWLRITGFDYDDNFDFLCISPDGSLLAMGFPDGTIRIYDAKTYEKIYSWQAHTGHITYLGFTPDSTLLISASIHSEGDGYVKAWGIIL